MRADPALRPVRVGSRNATFQHWETLLRNRTKRHRAGAFVVQGVRPITLAVRAGWHVTDVLRPAGGQPSRWAQDTWGRPGARRYELEPELFAELSGKDEGQAELLAVVAIPPDDLTRADPSAYAPTVVFDRPSTPGNVGTLLRSIDAFGGSGLVVTGHAADPYDPKSVRASTGSLFTVPTVRADGPEPVLDRIRALRSAGSSVQLLGTDEGGDLGVRGVDFAVPTVLVVGNETRGLARVWREACDAIVSIPMVGEASSLNAAIAGSVLLHESLQQRLDARR
ncbi:TrmH family RNA methyltransferase [Allobranchiibius sp. GilTou38]|uniref:TrmH family RNA methyltransferase n=1 Tax=Allobranchiibius sp. GilTou38 TaxID=2815210 RepID=UPI001AA18EA3|nr:TrmH family RNA methyltransferase [Allobranchiibius sp. GilTou38]MBO1768065.1 rRNA methyltransferase [Allobranchiibius sp. GilTou38]